jgi:hypothetical protein
MASRDIAIACHAVDSQGALVVDGTTLYSTGLAGGAGAARRPRSAAGRYAWRDAANWPTTWIRAAHGA